MMTELVIIQDKQAVTSSRNIAEKFGKLHKDVLESIRQIIKAENSALTFYRKTSYKAGTGKSYPEYLMNKDGFMLLVMGFTGKAAMDIKIAYINAFNEMEAKLREMSKPKQIPLLKVPPAPYVYPEENAEYMQLYHAVQGYMDVMDEFLPRTLTTCSEPQHGALLEVVFLTSCKLTKAIQDMQYIKLR